MRLALAHARAETVQMARYPAYALPTILFPAVMLLLFGRQFEHGEPNRLLAGFGATGLLAVAFFQFGAGIASSRATPWEAYLRTLPVSATSRLAGRVFSALAFAAATAAAVTTIAVTAYDVGMPLWRFGLLVVALLAGSAPFALAGIAIGYWLQPRAALTIANVVYLPLAVGGFLWVRPTDDVPRALDLASQCLPTRSWIEILDSIATGDRPLPLHHVASLAAWGVVFFVAAWLGYRRDEGERFR